MKKRRFSERPGFVSAVIVMFLLAGGPGDSLQIARGKSTNVMAFSDVSSMHPFGTTIGDLKKQGVIKGYTDGSFKPDFSISRAEFLTLVMKPVMDSSGNSGQKKTDCFDDVKKEWFAPYVCEAKALGVISGYKYNLFKPHNNINFAEASKILAGAYKLKTGSAAKDEAWFTPYVKALGSANATPVSIDYMDKKVSRAETAEMVLRLSGGIKNRPAKSYEALVSAVPSVSSCAELQEKISYQQYVNSYSYSAVKAMPSMMSGVSAGADMAMVESSAGDDEADMPQTESSTSNAATEYSSTNVQVDGVDEADIIKNDGEFIYMVSGKGVRIIKAYTPDQLAEIAKVTFDDENFRPLEIYTTSDRLVVIGNTWTNSDQEIYYGGYSSLTKVLIIDIADKQNPAMMREVEFQGYQISSRRIGDRLYLVTNYTPNYYVIAPLEEEDAAANDGENSAGEEIVKILPHFTDSVSGETMPVSDCEEIRFLPRYEEMNMLTVSGIDISAADSEISRETIMGSGTTIYSSVENLYVASTRYGFPVAGIFNTWIRPPREDEKTVLYRFALDEGKVTFASQGEVKGHLLNQFSMDENGGAFRVATTTGEVWNSQNLSKNHLLILDRNDLSKELGKIENIAPGEKIYSVRFLGDRAYMVTFKKVDPFFVIDVADPTAPKILGALKIPGYSDYLHPFDENHIIGFGKDAVDPSDLDQVGWGRDVDFAWYQGMKIALFDVTDVANPKLQFNEVIGDRGTESELLQNHKALYFDKKTGILAFPVTVAEIKDKEDGEYTGSEYGDTVFQGAYIYKLDLENGFQLKGKITHYDQETIDKQGDYWYDTGSTIHRILSIGEYLYTVSLGKISAANRDSIEIVNSVELEVEENDDFGIWIE